MYKNFDIGYDLKMAFEDGYRVGVEAAQPRWISVKDALPKKSGKYIVCTVKGSVYCTSAVISGDEACFKSDINTHITHWMPLPEAPKEDIKNERFD